MSQCSGRDDKYCIPSESLLKHGSILQIGTKKEKKKKTVKVQKQMQLRKEGLCVVKR